MVYKNQKICKVPSWLTGHGKENERMLILKMFMDEDTGYGRKNYKAKAHEKKKKMEYHTKTKMVRKNL